MVTLTLNVLTHARLAWCGWTTLVAYTQAALSPLLSVGGRLVSFYFFALYVTNYNSFASIATAPIATTIIVPSLMMRGYSSSRKSVFVAISFNMSIPKGFGNRFSLLFRNTSPSKTTNKFTCVKRYGGHLSNLFIKLHNYFAPIQTETYGHL